MRSKHPPGEDSSSAPLSPLRSRASHASLRADTFVEVTRQQPIDGTHFKGNAEELI